MNLFNTIILLNIPSKNIAKKNAHAPQRKIALGHGRRCPSLQTFLGTGQAFVTGVSEPPLAPLAGYLRLCVFI